MTSCAEHQYFVKGTSNQSILDGEYAYMLPMHSNSRDFLDSCRVVHGKFEMSGPLDSVQCVVISMGNFGIPMVLESGEVHISFQSSDTHVSGTPLNDTLYRFLYSRDSLLMLRNDIQSSSNDLLRKGYSEEYVYAYCQDAFMESDSQLDSLEYNFVRDNYTNVLGVTWFLRMGDRISRQTGYYTLTPLMEKLYNQAPEVFKKNSDISSYYQHAVSPREEEEVYRIVFSFF